MTIKNENTFKKLLLSLDIQFFAAEKGGEGGEGGNGSQEGGQSSDGKEKTDTKDQNQNEHMIPKSRFDEVNENYKNMKAEFEKMKTAQSEAEKERQRKEQEEAEKKGEFERLYNKTKTELDTYKTESKSAKERVEALEGVINGLLETKLESIDKEFHDLIPSNMTPEQKLAWVNAAEAKGLFGKKSVNEPLGSQTNPNTNQEVDINTMNPLQMMLAGYKNK